MKEQVIAIMSEVFELNIADFPHEVNQDNIDNWDSMRHLNLIVELEDVFDKSFEPEEIAEMVTMDKILEYLNK